MKRFLKYDTEIVKKENSPVDKMGVIKDEPLAYEYMPEGYPRKETTMQEVVILDNARIGSTFIGGGMYQISSDKSVDIIPIVGNTYTLNCDGVDYEITAIETGNGNAVCDLDASNTPLNTRFVVKNDKTLSGGVVYSAVDEHVVSITGMQEITMTYPMSKDFMHGASVFVVSFERNSDHNWTCDKTIDEIIEADKSGYVVIGECRVDDTTSNQMNVNLLLTGHQVGEVYFYGHHSYKSSSTIYTRKTLIYYGDTYGIVVKDSEEYSADLTA